MDRDAYGAKVRTELAGWETIPDPDGYQLFTPVIHTFLKEHLFAYIFGRNILDYQGRELATTAALASMMGTADQFRFQFGTALNTRLTTDQLKSFVSVLDARKIQEEAGVASEILDKVLSTRAH